MSASAILDQLESTSDRQEAIELLKSYQAPIGADFFDRVVSLLGADLARCKNLCRWSDILRSEDRPWAHRITAVQHRIAGDWIKAASEFQLAGKYAKNELAIEMQIGAIDSLGRAGKVDEAIKLAERLRSQAGRNRLLLGRISLNAGNAFLWHDEYASANRWLHAATDYLDDPLQKNSAKLGLSTANLFGGSAKLAQTLATEAAEAFGELNLEHYRAMALLNVAMANIILGRADRAVQVLLEVKSKVEEGSWESARVQELLGDAYLNLNLWQEATNAYQLALRSHEELRQVLNQANSHLGLGEVYRELGQSKDAREQLRLARQQFSKFGNSIWENVARLEQQRFRRSGVAMEEIANQVSHSPYFYCKVLIQVASLDSLKRAKRLVDRYGFIDLEWEIYYQRGLLLRRNARLREWDKMAKAIWSHRMLQESSISRVSMLQDKAEALGRYFSELVRAHRNNEALELIKNTRSISLIDEVLKSNQDSETTTQLQELREEFRQLIENGRSWGSRRPATLPRNKIADLRRTWTEARWNRLQSVGTFDTNRNFADTVLYVDANHRLYRAFDGQITELEITREGLSKELAWLHFELLEPQFSRDTETQPCLERLDRIREVLQWQPSPRICPDGIFWGVPWQALCQGTSNCEVSIAIAPWINRPMLPKTPTDDVAIWYSEHEALPKIKSEAEHFVQEFPNAKVIRTAAEARQMMAGGNLKLLHIATHAIHSSENPMFSSIIFNDGVITSGEIAVAPWTVNSVIINSCDSGRLVTSNNFEPDGISRAFFAAGASEVIASQWQLDDEAAYIFSKLMIKSLKKGLSFREGLAESRAGLRDEMPHPYYWAPLVHMSGYET